MFSQIRNISIACIMLIALGGVFQTATADTETNKTISRRDFEEALNQGKLEVYDEIIAPEAILHTVSGDIIGLDAIKGFAGMIITAFPDIHFTIEDMVAEGDLVVTRWSNTGTQQGEYMGIPATGISTAGTGMSIHRIADDKIQELWLFADNLGMLQQLGVMTPGRPSPEDYIWSAPSEVTGEAGDPEANKGLITRFAEEVWNQHKLDVMDDIFIAEVISHNPPVDFLYGPSSLETLKQAVTDYLTAYPDFHVVVHDMIAEGDKAVGRWTVTATHLGELMGIPATGRPVSFTGTTMYRFADGKVVDMWWAWDTLGMMQQLTAPEWPIEGVWIERTPPEVGPHIWIHTINSQNATRNRFTSMLRLIADNPTGFGLFPEGEFQSFFFGQTLRTSLNSYESSMVCHATKKGAEFLTEIVWIGIYNTKWQLLDRNTLEGVASVGLYPAETDADGDGLPDEGQEPTFCYVGVPYTGKRVPVMPPCVPPPQGQ